MFGGQEWCAVVRPRHPWPACLIARRKDQRRVHVPSPDVPKRSPLLVRFFHNRPIANTARAIWNHMVRNAKRGGAAFLAPLAWLPPQSSTTTELMCIMGSVKLPTLLLRRIGRRFERLSRGRKWYWKAG